MLFYKNALKAKTCIYNSIEAGLKNNARLALKFKTLNNDDKWIAVYYENRYFYLGNIKTLL